MENIKQIKAEIRKMVQDTVDSGTIGHVQFFTAKIMADRADIQGQDADFYTICARETIVGMVKSAVAKYEKPEAETPILDGFEHLRTAYPVHRGNDHLLVPVHLCTDEELEARASEYEAAANGMRNHAKEIRAYIQERKDQAASQTA